MKAQEKKTNPNRKKQIYLFNIILLCLVTAATALICMVIFVRYELVKTELGGIYAQLESSESLAEKEYYDQEDVRLREQAAREEGISEEKKKLQNTIRSSLESGESTLAMLRALYEDELVVYSGGSYHFFSILKSVPRNGFSKGDFKTDAQGILQYSGSRTGQKTIQGVCVSASSGEIDWKSVKEDDISFALIRAGCLERELNAEEADSSGKGSGSGGGNTKDSGNAQNGQDPENDRFVQDPLLSKNLTAAKEAGLDTAVWYRISAATEEEVLLETEEVIRAVNREPAGTLSSGRILIILSEENGITDRESLTRQQWTSLMTACCQKILGAGYEPVVCGSVNSLTLYLDVERLSDYAFALINFDTEPYFPYEFKYWMYSPDGTVSGIDTEAGRCLQIGK